MPSQPLVTNWVLMSSQSLVTSWVLMPSQPLVTNWVLMPSQPLVTNWVLMPSQPHRHTPSIAFRHLPPRKGHRKALPYLEFAAQVTSGGPTTRTSLIHQSGHTLHITTVSIEQGGGRNGKGKGGVGVWGVKPNEPEAEFLEVSEGCKIAARPLLKTRNSDSPGLSWEFMEVSEGCKITARPLLGLKTRNSGSPGFSAEGRFYFCVRSIQARKCRGKKRQNVIVTATMTNGFHKPSLSLLPR